jgi:exodeoxyribonuclease VII large subunit
MPPERQIFTVSQLNRAAKDLLETYLPLLWVEGELSNLSAPSSGHWYFTLKDAGAQVRCAMFRNRNQLVRFKPETGKKVLVRAKVSLYEGRGDYQLIVEHMEPAGLGDLQHQFELLKARLQEEGLFDPALKKPLPFWPRCLGVITSPTGAAIRDILHVLQRRFPALPVVVLPVAVQGNEAAAQIANAIHLANLHQVCDLLIVGRGGGSLEDLWAFNEEVVARAIHASTIPIVSAVGHEVDFTIADFVADLRAPTPSAAAELVSPNQVEVQEQLERFERTLTRLIRQHLQWQKRQVQHLRARLAHPGQLLQQRAQRLDQLELRLKRALRVKLSDASQRLAHLNRSLQQLTPGRQLQQQRRNLDQLLSRLTRAQRHLLERRQQHLTRSAQLLHSVSPLNTLNRGYAIVLNPQGQAVRSATQVKLGERLQARLASGRIDCEVLVIHEDT